ncbi:hypothetical protein FAI40_04245 [Acetobacteraceae bacterium]|nr:hypothetical protein FAI40_04245 [Acetobacteraceae bacterium]
MHYLIYCDESAADGAFYSDFYGGGILLEKDRQKMEKSFLLCKESYKIQGEMKWSKVTPYALEAYKEYVDILFGYIRQNKLKIRIMFTQNVNELTAAARAKYRNQNKFYRLYYQF